MAEDSPGQTIRQGRTGIPLRGLRLDVVEGPDAKNAFVATSDRVTIGTAPGNDLLLTDTTVSRYHLEVVRRGDRFQVIDHGSTNGTFVAGVRLERGAITAGTILELGRSRVRVGEGELVQLELHGASSLGGLRGDAPVMRRLMAQIDRVAKSETSVLLVGESGTGKELIARALHDRSSRATKPFVTVDGGALTPSLVLSELFGHEKGAFTGADRRHPGAFERGHGGTVFLDEIGELAPSLQTTLLGALERRRFTRVGGTEEVSVDVRVVAATNRDLRAEVNRGAFRLDLYYRLAVATLAVPALRERTEDIPVLVRHFLAEAGHDGTPESVVPPETMEALVTHHWPGNVRELRNFVEATLALGEAPPLAGGPGSPASPDSNAVLALPYSEARRSVLDDFEGRFLRGLLARTNGNVSQAAREARMNRSHLIDLLKRHGISAKTPAG